MRALIPIFVLLLVFSFLSACGPSPVVPPANSTLTPLAARSAIPSQTLALRTITPTLPVPTRLANTTEVTFRWDVGTVITDVDDVTELAVRLRETPGILGAYGDEIQITVVYDPQTMTPDKILQILSNRGFPAKKP
jgi:hypothetical protein